MKYARWTKITKVTNLNGYPYIESHMVVIDPNTVLEVGACNPEWSERQELVDRAHLIAAAPEMLRELITARYLLNKHYPNSTYIDVLDGVIAKAKGEDK